MTSRITRGLRLELQVPVFSGLLLGSLMFSTVTVNEHSATPNLSESPTVNNQEDTDVVTVESISGTFKILPAALNGSNTKSQMTLFNSSDPEGLSVSWKDSIATTLTPTFGHFDTWLVKQSESPSRDTNVEPVSTGEPFPGPRTSLQPVTTGEPSGSSRSSTNLEPVTIGEPSLGSSRSSITPEPVTTGEPSPGSSTNLEPVTIGEPSPGSSRSSTTSEPVTIGEPSPGTSRSSTNLEPVVTGNPALEIRMRSPKEGKFGTHSMARVVTVTDL
ncbi:hypothetical protein BaRGS_00029672 [Batillaria attramentaria]|uniref:Uncharacterized protein n=1 Tax=Batillaria attramentaria TaxID=370345 RepID=A0ABD0JWX1_9CAEN